MKRTAIFGAVMLAGVSIAGCSSGYGYDRVGYAGYGGYEPYGYDSGYYGGGYYPGYASYYGWFGGFYYPGSGYYVYDRYRRPYRWTGAQQQYWNGRLNSYRGPRGGLEWRGFAGGASGYGGTANRGFAAQGRAPAARGDGGGAPRGAGSRAGGGSRGGYRGGYAH